MPGPAVGIVLTAEDKASATIKQVDQNVRNLSKTAGGVGRDFENAGNKIRGATQHINAFLQGAGIGVGIGSFYALERILGRIVRIIPDLVSQGAQWANTINNISDLTGMSAQHASTLAGAQQILGGTTDGLDRAMVALARSAVTNQTAFHQLGIQTKDSNGHLLDTWQIFQNVRQAIAATGGSLLSTNAAQKAFGRGSADLIDLLKLSDSQFSLLASEARRDGLIIGDAGSQMGEDWQRSLNDMGAAWQGVGSQIFQAVGPTLISVANGITQWLQQNMDSLVRFAVQAVNFISGLIGGFLGIDFGAVTFTQKLNDAGNTAGTASPKIADLGKKQDQLGSSTNAATNAIQNQISAIDAQIRKIDQAKGAYDYRAQLQQAQAQLHKAEKELDDVRSQGALSSEMSALERAQAMMQHQTDIQKAQEAYQKQLDAIKKMRHDREFDLQKQALENQKAGLEQQLALQRQAVAGQRAMLAQQKAQLHDWATSQRKDIGTAFDGIGDKFKTIGDQARQAGIQFATAIKTAIFGSDTGVGPNNPFTGKAMITIHQPGLLDKIGELINGLAGFGKTLGDTNSWLQSTFHTDLVTVAGALIGLKIAMSIGSPLLTLLGKIPGVPGAPLPTGAGAPPPGGIVTPLVGAFGSFNGADLLARLKRFEAQAGDPNHSDPFANAILNFFGIKGRGQSQVPTGKNSYYGDPFAGGPPGPALPPGYVQSYSQMLPLSFYNQSLLGNGLPWPGNGSQAQNNSASYNIEDQFTPLFRRFWGDGSDILQSSEDQQNALGYIGTNTATIPDGIDARFPTGTQLDVTGGPIGVQNPDWLSKFARIGQVTDWNAGNLKVVGTAASGAMEIVTGSGKHLLVSPDPDGHSFDVTNRSGKTFKVDANTEYGKKLAAAISGSGYLHSHVDNTVDVSVKNRLTFGKTERNDEAFWYSGHGTAAWVYNSYVRLGEIRDNGKTSLRVGAAQSGGGTGHRDKLDVIHDDLRVLIAATRHQTNVVHRDLSARRSPASTSTRAAAGTGL
jgi:hypothetical protein